eukprot:GHVU01124390.1.p2 GENE.GHVU01124390.1~~GHVU01124390.1.p2  ORF type:complete len:128 (+),score=15.62 GHVU01124390.1:376-759(+)
MPPRHRSMGCECHAASPSSSSSCSSAGGRRTHHRVVRRTSSVAAQSPSQLLILSSFAPCHADSHKCAAVLALLFLPPPAHTHNLPQPPAYRPSSFDLWQRATPAAVRQLPRQCGSALSPRLPPTVES